ncbi:MAG: hypothetical protein HPY76_10220 [Anaerolineae bacterium]|nr:hypothetical protein [Anaerolineae bacterium]
MEPVSRSPASQLELVSPQDAWAIVCGMLQPEMSPADYLTWVQPLQPLTLREGVFTIGARNTFGRDWVQDRLGSRIGQILQGIYRQTIHLRVTLLEHSMPPVQPDRSAPPAGLARPAVGAASTPEGASRKRKTANSHSASDPSSEGGSQRKLMLQRAYGSERARIIQPERGMFVTLYFFSNWLPLLGHSAMAVILAARAMCYWNPLTGELRNTVDTEMADLAKRASVSVRTVKDVLNQELVQRYFIRYTVRRVITSNGVRTAGISMQVRMDDPLTPADQQTSEIPEQEVWYSADFMDDEEDG